MEGSFAVPAGRRLSRVDSKTLRESFSGEASAEMEAVMRNLARKDDKIKYNRRMRVVLAGAIGVMVVMVGAMFAVTLSANEATKESHVKDSALVGKNGAAVQTDIFVNYASVFDLARFDAQTIVKTKKIALILENGEEAAFEITGAKKRPGSLQATFLTPGGHIVVDSAKMEATATVNCRTYKVAAPADVQQRRLAELDQAPRLFAERHLAIKDGKASGWAAVAVALAQAVQDKMDGKDMVSGWAVGTSAEGDKVEMFYQFNAGNTCNEKETAAPLVKDQCGVATTKCEAVNKPGNFAMFAYGEKEQEEGKGIQALFFDQDATIEGTIPADQHGASVVDFTVTSCADTKLDDLKVDAVSSDPRATTLPTVLPGFEVARFTRDDEVRSVLKSINIVNGKTIQDACKNLWLKSLEGPEGETEEDKNRRLREMNKASLKTYTDNFDELSASLTHEEVEKHPMRELLSKRKENRQLSRKPDQLAEDAYHSCTYKHASACAIREGCKFAFRGSDDFTDWVANGVGMLLNRKVNGIWFHYGFATEFMRLRSNSNIDSAVNGCSDPHFVGHSLGGAMANVARIYYGKGYVTTFGSPKPFNGFSAKCRFSGRGRYFHEGDPVAGHAFGLMAGRAHGQYGYELVVKCTKRNWRLKCTKYKRKWTGTTCGKGSGNFNFNLKYHSMTKTYLKYYKR